GRLGPRGVRLALGAHDRDGLGHACLVPGPVDLARTTEVVERVEYRVAVPRGVDEAVDPGPDRFAGRQPPEQLAAQQVLLASTPGRACRLGTSARELEVEQSLERVERRVERADGRAFDPLAVPAAVL